MNNYEKIIKHLKTVKTSSTSSITSSLGVDRKYLSILVEKGLIDHPSRGIYSLKNTIEDEYFSLSTRCKRCIFSHDTALFFHDLTDRTPLNFSITIPSGYNDNYLRKNDSTIEIFYIKKELHQIGKINMSSPSGKTIPVYDRERTICDLVRSKNRIESQIFTDALKKYSASNNKNLNKLMDYAQIFKVSKKIHEYMEVLI